MVTAVGSVVLAVVFATAGLAKLADPRGARSAVDGLVGGTGRIRATVARVLPAVELLVAGGLLVAATRWWAAVLALSLLLVFSAAIARALIRGDRPECRCFGRLRAAPIGWRTLARNLVLAGLALVVVVTARSDTGPEPVGWIAALSVGEVVALLLIAVVAGVLVGAALAVVHLLRSYGRVLVRLDAVETRLRAAGFELDDPGELRELGLAPGTPAPTFWLPTLEGDRLALDDLVAPGRPLLLLFTSPSCGSCSILMPAVADWQSEHAESLTIAVVSDGDAELVRAEVERHGLERVLLDERSTVYDAYQVNGTPSAVLVTPEGLIGSRLAAGPEWIEALVEQAIRPGALTVGAEVPQIALAILDGDEATLHDLVDGPSVALFWNPDCGYCRAMHDDVLAWEATAEPPARRLVVVSAGTAEEVRAEGFAAPVLLDPDWTLAGAVGADGTPMALSISADGRIEAPLATGADAVLRLIGVFQPVLDP